MKPLDCCSGVLVGWGRNREERHAPDCPQNIEMLALLAEEGIGMVGRKLKAEEIAVMDIALDTETGGLDPEIAPILGIDLWHPTGPCFSQRVIGTGRVGRFGNKMEIHPRALQANGLNPDEGVPIEEAAKRMVAWWKSIGSPQFHLVGHNVGPFDVPFLKQLTHVGVDVPWAMMFDYHYQDTATAAYLMQKDGMLHFGKWSLTNVCQVLGILYDPHLSKCDAKASWYANERMSAVRLHYKDMCERGEMCEGFNETHNIRDHLPALDLRG